MGQSPLETFHGDNLCRYEYATTAIFCFFSLPAWCNVPYVYLSPKSFVVPFIINTYTAAQEGPPPTPLTLDEIDVLRHREITHKALSAILLLLLKWFKRSRQSMFCNLNVNLKQSNVRMEQTL